MDLIVTVPDDRVAFVKKLLRELNLPVKPAAKAKPTATAKPRQYTPAQQQGKIELKSTCDLLDEF